MSVSSGVDAPREILFPRPLYASMISHAARKIEGHYLEDETPERKAFGLLAGRRRGDTWEVRGVIPLMANLRHDPLRKSDMDEIVDRHAIPSETPNENRGWIAAGREILAAEAFCDDEGWILFGHYHTHRVRWPDDPARDSCTVLDRVLAEGTGTWMFIVSVVDLNRPRVRAFYEGDNEKEAMIRAVTGGSTIS